MDRAPQIEFWRAHAARRSQTHRVRSVANVVVHLLAFCLILYGILEKNRR